MNLLLLLMYPCLLQLEHLPPVRVANYGYGPIVDDVESHVPDDQFAKSMRNPSDPGNWVHEMTHLINAYARQQGTNAAYVLDGRIFKAKEPGITLKQVAEEVPPEQRRGDYQHYLVFAQQYRNNQPLYVLDEASAAGNALCYQVSVGKMDKHRMGLVLEWIDYSNALVRAVEKHDPDYSDLGRLRAFVNWHNARGMFLVEKLND